MKKGKDLVITKNPKSLFAESIRSIRTNIAFSSLDKDVKIIMNTSPEAGDGKSFITANLAIAVYKKQKPADCAYGALCTSYKFSAERETWPFCLIRLKL